MFPFLFVSCQCFCDWSLYSNLTTQRKSEGSQPLLTSPFLPRQLKSSPGKAWLHGEGRQSEGQPGGRAKEIQPRNATDPLPEKDARARRTVALLRHGTNPRRELHPPVAPSAGGRRGAPAAPALRGAVRAAAAASLPAVRRTSPHAPAAPRCPRRGGPSSAAVLALAPVVGPVLPAAAVARARRGTAVARAAMESRKCSRGRAVPGSGRSVLGGAGSWRPARRAAGGRAAAPEAPPCTRLLLLPPPPRRRDGTSSPSP